jgi:hypothetical protein
MSKEMLPAKMGRDRGLGPESLPVVTDTKKGKKEGLIVVLSMAVGIGILIVASIFVLPYLSSLRGSILGGTDSITDSSSATFETTAILSPSFKAVDGKGNLVGTNNGVARSDQITISGYSSDTYNTELLCYIDKQPVYCKGGPINFSGIPNGSHEVHIVEIGKSEPVVSVFKWTTLSPN